MSKAWCKVDNFFSDFTNASASHEDDRAKESLPFPGFDDSEEIEKDDFEFISEDELAEALKKWFDFIFLRVDFFVLEEVYM